MSQLPDVSSWIKLLNSTTGKAIPSGSGVFYNTNVIVRYVVANDSNKPAGPFAIIGTVHKNGVGKTAVPLQSITLQPKEMWTKEFSVLSETPEVADEYVARMYADIYFNTVDPEEDAGNNVGKASFTIWQRPL